MTEDLELNELKANPPYPPAWLLAINGSTGKAHRLDLSPSARNPLYQKVANKGSFCKGAGAKRLRIFNQDILRPSAEILSANLMTNAQNDHSKSPLPPLLVCSRLTGLRARLSALTLRPQLASRFKKGGKKVAFTLAEGATHVDTFHDIRKPAFTLAEVLVTLGIIGIVAAMTLPMLAKNYQFFIRQQQFKKAYAELSIAVQKTQIDMGEGVKCYYVYRNGRDDYKRVLNDCRYFWNELPKNLQVLKTCQGSPVESGCISKDMKAAENVYAEVQGGENKAEALVYFKQKCTGFYSGEIKKYATARITASGIMYMPYYEGQTPIFLVDINALRGPNKWGHDIFIFYLEKRLAVDSVSVIRPSESCHPIDVGGYYSTHFFDYLYGQNAEL